MFAAAEAAAPRHPAGRADGTEGSVGQLPWVCLMKAGALVDLVWILRGRRRGHFLLHWQHWWALACCWAVAG